MALIQRRLQISQMESVLIAQMAQILRRFQISQIRVSADIVVVGCSLMIVDCSLLIDDCKKSL